MRENLAELRGRVAVVTGAETGIGAAVAEKFRRSGAAVYAVDVALQPGARSLQVNVTDEPAMNSAMEAVVAAEGRLDICIANAGISPSVEPTLNVDVAVWRDVLEVNLTGAFITMRAAAREMIRCGNGGRIVVTASVAAFRGEYGGAAYCASKFGLRGLVESMALELASDGITVNGVAPGEVDTQLHESLMAKYAEARGRSVAEMREDLLQRIPAGRLATADEISDAFAFLASAGAGYVTGSFLRIDGGELLA